MSWLKILLMTRNCLCWNIFLVESYTRYVFFSVVLVILSNWVCWFVRWRRKFDFFAKFLKFSVLFSLILCIALILFVRLNALWCLCGIIILRVFKSFLTQSLIVVEDFISWFLGMWRKVKIDSCCLISLTCFIDLCCSN